MSDESISKLICGEPLYISDSLQRPLNVTQQLYRCAFKNGALLVYHHPSEAETSNEGIAKSKFSLFTATKEKTQIIPGLESLDLKTQLKKFLDNFEEQSKVKNLPLIISLMEKTADLILEPRTKPKLLAVLKTLKD